MQYSGQEIYSIGQNEIPINLRIDWAWQEITRTHPEFKREQWPTDWDDPYQLYEIVVNNVCGYIPKSGDVVMDIGANFGVFTAYCALNGCWVYAYEPHPVAYKMLKETVKRTGIRDNVEGYDFAIWTEKGISLPFMSNSGYEIGATWLWSNGTLVVDNGPVPESRAVIHVPTVTLEEALSMEDEWDCVKMDIEGAEFDVLLDASDECLRKIKYLTIEVHNHQANKDKHDAMAARLETIFTLTGTKDGNPELAGQDRWISLFATRK